MEPSYTIITGALGGLGSAFAFEFARQGTHLVLIDRAQDAKALENFLSENFKIQTLYIPCDLTDQNARAVLFKRLQDEAIVFNGLVNVVGQEMEGKFLTRTRSEILHMLHLNIEALVDLSYFALNQHHPDQKFLLINVASLAGFFSIPYKALYAASKRFIIHFSLALREEVREFGNVTVLCPGGLPTNPEAMKKIFLQGFWGKITAHDTHRVVKHTLKKARRNRPMHIPGCANKLLIGLARLLPSSWVAGFLANRWGRRQEQLDYWRMTQPNPKK